MLSVGDTFPQFKLKATVSTSLDKAFTQIDNGNVARLQAEPKTATTIAALFHLYKNTRAQLDTTVAKLSAGDVPRLDYAPSDEVTDFLEKHRNFFPELDFSAFQTLEQFAAAL